MLAIILGVLAGVFFLVTIILIIYILRRRWRKRHYPRQGIGSLFFKVRAPSQKSDLYDVTDAFDVSRYGTSMRETVRGDTDSVKPVNDLRLDTAIIPFTDMRTLPDLPYDPHYAEVCFGRDGKEDDAVSLSSRSGSASSYEQYLHSREDTTQRQPKQTSHTYSLLDPDTSIVPVEDYENQ